MPLETERTVDAAIHPEQESQLSFTAKRWWKALVHPQIRLQSRLPWGLKEFSKIYAVAAVYYVVGSIIPLLVLFGAMLVAIHFAPDMVLQNCCTADGHPNTGVMLVATISSFLAGFGAELMYINKELRKKGLSLARVMGLNLDSLNGSWKQAFKMAFIALIIGLTIQNLFDLLPIPKPHQATADMASHLQGGGLMAFTALAAFAAPFFEEVIFRGCLFNAFRNIFREGRIFSMLKYNSRAADYLAITLSAFMFAAAHMDLTAFAQLFILGVLLAEVYRRSGSLVCPMLLHAMNNAVATILIVFHQVS